MLMGVFHDNRSLKNVLGNEDATAVQALFDVQSAAFEVSVIYLAQLSYSCTELPIQHLAYVGCCSEQQRQVSCCLTSTLDYGR